MTRRTQRGDVEMALVFAMAALVIAGVALICWTDEQGNDCRAKGGVYFCAYKSPCLCLAKGVVLP